MPLPRLLHPVPVFIRQISRGITPQDHNAREPRGQAYRKQKPIKLRAQVRIGDTDEPAATAGGVTESSEGYLLFLTRELKAAKVTIDRGDQVVQIGEGAFAREVDYYITKLQHRGHYPNAKGPTLLKAFFSDRHPSRQRGDL